MNKRFNAGRPNVGILLKVPVAIEQAGRCDQSDLCQKHKILAKAGAREHGPSNPLRHSSDFPRESRLCSDLSKRLGNAPTGAAVDGIELFPRGCAGSFSLLGPDANSWQLRRLLVKCGLPIGGLLA